MAGGQRSDGNNDGAIGETHAPAGAGSSVHTEDNVHIASTSPAALRLPETATDACATPSSKIDGGDVEAGKPENGQPMPGSQEWELLSLSQVSLNSSMAGLRVDSSSSFVSSPSRSVIALGGLGVSLVDSAHFDASEPRMLWPSPSRTPAGSLVGEVAGRGGSSSAGAHPISGLADSESHQPSAASPPASSPMFVMWQRELQASGSASASGPPMLAVSAAGVTANTSNLSSAQLGDFGQQQEGQSVGAEHMWSSFTSSLSTLPTGNSQQPGRGDSSNVVHPMAVSGWVGSSTEPFDAIGHSYLGNESERMANFNAYLSETFGRESWQVRLPAGTVSFMGTASSTGGNLSTSSLPPGSMFLGPTSHIPQRLPPGGDCGSHSWTLVPPGESGPSVTGDVSNVQKNPPAEDSPDDAFSSLDSDDSLGSESGPQESSRVARDADRIGTRSGEGNGNLLGLPRESLAEGFQGRIVQGENSSLEGEERTQSDRNQDRPRSGLQRSSWLSLSLGETWWSERGGLVRRIWAGLEEQQGALWATALAAAVVGLVFLAQRWQLERRRNEQLHLLLRKREERINQLKVQMVRLTEAMSRQRRVPVIRTSASFPTLSSLG